MDVNRYVLLTLYLLVVLLRGCTYWGWNGIQEMLYKSGAYLWTCDEPEKITYLEVGGKDYVDCPDRKQVLGGIFTTALGSNLISSFFSGIILDQLGPKIAMLFGITMDVIGWLLLGFSGVGFQAYYGAAFCIGVAADPGYLPLLSVSRLFPRNSSFVISILGSMRSVSFAIPVIMSIIFQSDAFLPGDLWKMCVGYVAVAQGLCLIITLVFIPMKAFESPDVAVEGTVEENAGSEEKSAVGGSETSASGKPPADTAPFLKLLIDPKFLLILPIFAAALVRTDYYAKSNKEQLVELATNRNLYEMFSVCNVLSFLPGPVFGKLVDLYGILLVLFLLNTSGVFMFIFLIFDSLVCKGISIFFYFIYTSFVLSNVYCYISIHFPASSFGKLAGLVSAFGGCVALLSIVWYKELLKHEFPKSFRIADGIMVGIGVFVYFLIFALWRIGTREKKTKKVLDTQNTTAETPESSSVVV